MFPIAFLTSQAATRDALRGWGPADPAPAVALRAGDQPAGRVAGRGRTPHGPRARWLAPVRRVARRRAHA
jgi:hypothetical protein